MFPRTNVNNVLCFRGVCIRHPLVGRISLPTSLSTKERERIHIGLYQFQTRAMHDPLIHHIPTFYIRINAIKSPAIKAGKKKSIPAKTFQIYTRAASVQPCDITMPYRTASAHPPLCAYVSSVATRRAFYK